MPTFEIPCDVYARLAGVTDTIYFDGSPWCKTMRIEDGKAIVTNRKVMVIESIGGPKGVGHVIIDPQLVAQCRTEAPFDSKLTVTIDDALRFGTAKTTLGYCFPGNVGRWGPEENELARWRTALPIREATASDGAMLWDAPVISALCASSPTGGLVFPRFIDCNMPVVIRDASDDRWCGIFLPRAHDSVYGAAKLPEWCK